ncbi:MAG: hypothetical protein LQ338_000439 [Usnochroma carphineum]|nr:MAG: hypothetical protein LQ338_000439 [Usnochroma carphineum]
MGGSGGGPYALVAPEPRKKEDTDSDVVKACAYALPSTQLKGAAVLAGVGPPEDSSFSQMRLGTRLLYAGLRYAPSLVGAVANVLVGRKARILEPEELKGIMPHLKYLKAVVAPNERELLENPYFIMGMVQAFQEHFRQGPKGFIRDGQLLLEPWGFKLEDIPFPGVRLYYGSEDINTPPQMGRNMAAKLERSVYKEYEGETHKTLFGKHGDDILRDIAGPVLIPASDVELRSSGAYDLINATINMRKTSIKRLCRTT